MTLKVIKKNLSHLKTIAWIWLIFLIGGWAWTYWQTRGALAYDGAIEYAYPWSAALRYQCGMTAQHAHECSMTYRLDELALDLILLAMPIAILLRKKKREKQI